jgi:hypothetical protein
LVPPALNTRGIRHGSRAFANNAKRNLDTVAARVKIDSSGFNVSNCSLVHGDFRVGHGVVVDKDFRIVDVDLNLGLHSTTVLVASCSEVKRELKSEVVPYCEICDIGILSEFRAASLLVSKRSCCCFRDRLLSSEDDRCVINVEGVGNLVVSFVMGVAEG